MTLATWRLAGGRRRRLRSPTQRRNDNGSKSSAYRSDYLIQSAPRGAISFAQQISRDKVAGARAGICEKGSKDIYSNILSPADTSTQRPPFTPALDIEFHMLRSGPTVPPQKKKPRVCLLLLGTKRGRQALPRALANEFEKRPGGWTRRLHPASTSLNLRLFFDPLVDLLGMELSCVASPGSLALLSSSSSPSSPSSSLPSPSYSCSSGCGYWGRGWRKPAGWARIKASAEGSRERIDSGESRRREFTAGGGPAMEVSASPASVSTTNTTVIERSFVAGGDSDFPVWDKLGAIVRLSYGIGVYGAMALAGKFICSITGIDCTGGFHPSLEAILDGLGYAAPPIMALLFILDDEVVKYSPHARAIRDVEDEELRSFFYGMSPWQFILIVAASSIGEELFYRVAVQGALADMFLRSTELMKDARGIASMTGMLPLFVPFAQAFAAVITAALTGSLYYVATAPKDPAYVVSPVLSSSSGREDLKKLFAAWYERRQMRKIYSPLLEGLLALYLGFEWIQTDNILAPMITHGIYSAVVLGHGLFKIHDHRRKLRQRIQQVRVETDNTKS